MFGNELGEVGWEHRRFILEATVGQWMNGVSAVLARESNSPQPRLCVSSAANLLLYGVGNFH
jgi:hypothetical protein